MTSLRQNFKAALDDHQGGRLDDEGLIARITEAVAVRSKWPISRNGVPTSRDWDVIEGRLSSRRDLLLRLRLAVVRG